MRASRFVTLFLGLVGLLLLGNFVGLQTHPRIVAFVNSVGPAEASWLAVSDKDMTVSSKLFAHCIMIFLLSCHPTLKIMAKQLF